MTRRLAEDLGLLLLRLAGVGMAVFHGWGKVVALGSGGGERFIQTVSNLGFPLPVLFAWAAALTELVGGVCLALGLGVRVAAPALAFTMFVAAFGRHHALDHLWVALGLQASGTLEGTGSPEKALVYMIIFVALALLGPGGLSLDRKWRRH